MTDTDIYKILLPIKVKVLTKVQQSLLPSKRKNILKEACPEINIWSTVERSLSTQIGLKLQEIATLSSHNVVNLDKHQKYPGIDIRIDDIWEGQLKTSYNTQTGTHKQDALKVLIDSTTQRNTKPFFAIAFGENEDYMKRGIRFLSGPAFWSILEIDYHIVHHAVVQFSREIRHDVNHLLIDDNAGRLF